MTDWKWDAKVTKGALRKQHITSIAPFCGATDEKEPLGKETEKNGWDGTAQSIQRKDLNPQAAESLPARHPA